MSSQSVSLNLIVKNPDEDFKLVQLAIDGSRDAFKELFIKNVSRIHSLCLRISADTFVAEELTQEVFIKAWEKLKTFQFESKFSSWLHSIAVNQFLMHLRSEKRLSEKNLELKEEKNLEESKHRQDIKIDLEKAISKLPAQARAVLVLHDIEGYKHNEISRMMGIQIGTSKAHLHNARKILREELSK
ncbi:MAG: RNA polymerase sigma factor [Bacteroidota bacterium]|nr:RNA polymerase sigma factor [Bacteroidota bacterium]